MIGIVTPEMDIVLDIVVLGIFLGIAIIFFIVGEFLLKKSIYRNLTTYVSAFFVCTVLFAILQPSDVKTFLMFVFLMFLAYYYNSTFRKEHKKKKKKVKLSKKEERKKHIEDLQSWRKKIKQR